MSILFDNRFVLGYNKSEKSYGKNKGQDIMKNLNYRKIILLFADVFIIIVSGITLNYALSLTKVISAEASRMLFYYLLINILTCELMMLLFGSYSRIWRYFNIRDYIMCGAGMTVGFLMGYGVLLLINMKPRKVFFVLFYVVATTGVLLFRFLFKSMFDISTIIVKPDFAGMCYF